MTPYLTTRSLYPPLIHKSPSPLLGLVVVIPCFDEAYLLLALMSLKKCGRPKCDVEVIIVVNHSEKTADQIKKTNHKTYEQAHLWAQQNRLSHLRFYVLMIDDMPAKHAGVGLARKIGMDEACYRFHKAGNTRGVIACFDADSRCEANYFQELEKYFEENSNAQACGIHFEHPLEGVDFSDEIYDAITLYELHLRYYVNAQKWAGFPYAWQTIGSSMAVRCDAYQKQGGMNRRQAGEDFYFLHKFIPLGHFGEIKTTKVIPSPRPSHRVPFGTGKAVGALLQSKGKYLTYNPLSFQDLFVFFREVWPGLHELKYPVNVYDQLPESIASFLSDNDFTNKLTEIKSHTANKSSFEKRLSRWFDAFLLMKYMHFARDHFHPDIEVSVAASWLLHQLLPETDQVDGSAKSMLLSFRQIDMQAYP